jgi:hypothetical protein
MRTILSLLFCSLVLLACGGAQIPGATAAALQRSRVAVAFNQCAHKIVYGENVMKVLWNESREQQAVFEGIWNSSAALSDTFASELRRLGLDVVELQDLSPDAPEHASIAESGCTALTSSMYYDRRTPLYLTPGQRKLVQGGGARYLLLWSTGGHIAKAYGSSGVLYLSGDLIVYDLAQGKQIHLEPLVFSTRVRFQKSIREIEANDLALLKQLSVEGVAKVTREEIPAVLGME